MSDDYHLGELEVARDPSHPSHVSPPPLPPSKRVLDVGCGAGQTLIAVYPDRISFGVDVDVSALRLGRTLTDNVRFACARAEALPYRSQSFDMVVARVSLSYTNVPVALREMSRVLSHGGELWITVHPFSIVWKHAKGYNWKHWVFFGYILLNSALFELMQKQFAFLGKYESFQTERGLSIALRKSGFADIKMEKSGERFVVTARLK